MNFKIQPCTVVFLILNLFNIHRDRLHHFLSGGIKPPSTKVVLNIRESLLESSLSCMLRVLNTYLLHVIASNPDQSIVKYAHETRRNMLRAITCGTRSDPPSTAELESTICRHPGDYSYPLSVPIFLVNDNHYLAGFDGSATFGELAEQVCFQLC